MYRQGLGDCFLVSLPRTDGGTRPFYVMIDCGVVLGTPNPAAIMKQVLDSIVQETGGAIDLLIATHEHWDHLSGFVQAKDSFDRLTKVGQVWLAWTEDPSDPQARQLDKFKSGALNALQQTSARLNSVQGLSPHLSIIQDGLQAVMGFNFGAKGEKVRSARDAATQLAAQKRYLEPSTAPISLPGLSDTLRIYVLGPPRDAAMLGITDRPTEMYGLATAGGWSIAAVLGDAFTAQAGSFQTRPDNSAPFNPEEGIDLRGARSAQKGTTDAQVRQTSQFLRDYYDGPVRPSVGENPQTTRRIAPDPNETDQTWRRIDNDWLGVSSDLAIQLDDRTNNSSRTGIRIPRHKAYTTVRRRRAGRKLAQLGKSKLEGRQRSRHRARTSWPAPCFTKSGIMAATMRRSSNAGSN